MGFADYFSSTVQSVETALEKRLSEDRIGRSALAEAMRYSVLGGGKRFRAFLAIEFCRMNGGDYKSALPYAEAIELAHSASLVHDDMPCMDDDDLRRGKPSCHSQFGESIALLAGDALLMLAYECIASNDLVPAETNVRAVNQCSKMIGVCGVCRGQEIDLSQDISDYASLKESYYLKTGKAIEVAALLGYYAAVDKPSEAICAQIRSYAADLGLAFQLMDDILDVYGEQKQLGKPVGSDKKNQKATALSFFSLQDLLLRIEELLDRAKKVFSDDPRGQIISELPDYIHARMIDKLDAEKVNAGLWLGQAVPPERRYGFLQGFCECDAGDDIERLLRNYGIEPHPILVRLGERVLRDSAYVRFRKHELKRRVERRAERAFSTGLRASGKKSVAVIGAGLAGITCAFLLKQAGFDVIVLEKEKLNSKEKLCGGILSRDSIALLTGIYGEEIRDVFRQEISTCRDQDNKYFQNLNGYATVVRKELDDYLLRRYLDIGGCVLESANVEQVSKDSGDVSGIISTSKEQFSYHADYIVAADGARSSVRKLVCGAYPQCVLALEVNVRSVSDSLILAPDKIDGMLGYSWYIPQGDTANIGCSFADHQTLQQSSRQAMVSKLRGFAERVHVDFDETAIHGAFLPAADVKLQEGRVSFIGDAAGLVDTHSGEGIVYALESAQILAKSLIFGLDYREQMEKVTRLVSLSVDSREEYYDFLLSFR